MAREIRSGDEIPVEPKHINYEPQTFARFKGSDVQEQARCLTLFCKQRWSWAPFTVEDVDSFLEEYVKPPVFGYVPRLSVSTLVQAGVVTGPFFTEVRVPGSTWKEMKDDAILRSLIATGHNNTHAAKLVGVSVRTIQARRAEWKENPPSLYFLTYEFLQCLGVPMTAWEKEAAVEGSIRGCGMHIQEIEKCAILTTLESANGSTARAAEILGVSTRVIQYRLKAWGMKSTDFRQVQYLEARHLQDA